MAISCKSIYKKNPRKIIKAWKKLFLGLDIKYHIGSVLSKYKGKLNLYLS